MDIRNRGLLLIFATLFAATISNGQATRDHTAQDARMKITVEDLPDGRTLFSVQNRSSQPITALALQALRTLLPPKKGSDKSVRYFDSFVNMGPDSSIMPYQSHTFIIFGKSPSSSEASRDVELKAAIFANGTSFGDPAWVGKLRDRRKFFSEYLADVSETLRSALQNKVSTNELVGNLQHEEAARMRDAGSLDEKIIVNGVYEDATHYLTVTFSEDVPEANRIRVLLDQFRAKQTAMRHSLAAD